MLFPLVYLGAKVTSCFIGAKVRFSFVFSKHLGG